MNRFLSFIFLCGFLLMLSGCTDSKVYKIGVSQCSQDDWRMKMNDEINREIMFHEDAEVEIRSADDSNEKQIEDIKYFVDNGFDIIIVSPNEAAALTPIIKEVYDRGIPVVIFDRNIIGDTYTARIGVDNEGLGRSAAHYALHMLGSGAKAIEIFGLKGSTPAEGRHEGFVKEFEADGGELLASVPGNWNKEDAIPVVDSLLKVYSDVDLIYAHNDRMAIGASEVAHRRSAQYRYPGSGRQYNRCHIPLSHRWTPADTDRIGHSEGRTLRKGNHPARIFGSRPFKCRYPSPAE